MELGRVFDAVPIEHTIRITNRDRSSVTITSFQMSCNCLQIHPDRDVSLDAGEASTFLLRLMPEVTEVSAQGGGVPTRIRITANYTTSGNGRIRTTAWNLRADVVKLFRIDARSLRLGTHSAKAGTIRHHVEMVLVGEVSRIECEPNLNWLISTEEREGAAGERRYVLTLLSRGSLSPRLVGDVIRFTPIDRDGRSYPPQEMKVEGEVLPDVLTIPREVHCGYQPVGTERTESVRVESLTGRRVRIGEVKAAGVTVTQVGPDAAVLQIRVPVVAESLQTHHADVVVHTDDGETQRVMIPIRYHGIGK